MMADPRPEVTVLYAAGRYLQHLSQAPFWYYVAVAVFYWQLRRWGFERMRGWWALIVPAIAIFILISMREIFDVAAGDPIWKSFSDWSSHILGLGVMVWAVYRFAPLFYEIFLEIRSRKALRAMDRKRR